MHFELDRNPVALIEILSRSDAGFDRHDIALIFGKQGRLPLSFANAHTGGDHSPAISHECGYGIQVAALLRRNGNEVPRGGATPEPNFAARSTGRGLYKLSEPTP